MRSPDRAILVAVLGITWGATLRVCRLARMGSVRGVSPRKYRLYFGEVLGQHHQIGLIRVAKA